MSDNSGRSRLRYIPILALLALASAAASVAFCISRWDGFAERYRLEEHMEAYRDRKPGKCNSFVKMVKTFCQSPCHMFKTLIY